MNKQEQHIALCEWMEIHVYQPFDRGFPKSVCECGGLPTEHQPAPSLTLDWLHECEEKLGNLQKITYLMRLSQPYKECIPLDPQYAEEQWLLVHATKEQRREALAHTLWTERFE